MKPDINRQTDSFPSEITNAENLHLFASKPETLFCIRTSAKQTRAEKGQREGLPRELEVFGRCCKALYPEVKKERMDEIEHLPSFPANLSYTRGQWKIHLVRFGRSTHARLLIHVGLWGWKGGWIPVERNELSPPRNTAKSVESSWKARRSLLPSHEYTSQP